MTGPLDEREARGALARHLAGYRARPYAELAALVARQPDPVEVTGATGARYQLEVIAVWDAGEGGDVRIIGSVDDGGWRAWRPLSDDFVMRPDGSILGGDAG